MVINIILPIGIGIGLYLVIGFICGMIGIIKYLPHYFAAGWRFKEMSITLFIYSFFWGFIAWAILKGEKE